MAAHRHPKRVVYTCIHNNYAPEVREITFPLLKRWADKSRADFVPITERRWPAWPVNMEKFGVWYLAKEAGYEEIILMDADALCHPDNFWPFNVEPYLSKKVVFHNGFDFCYLRWAAGHPWLWRDGRNIGSGTWMVGCTDWTLDLFHPPDAEYPSIEEASQSIYPLVSELKTVIDGAHLLDDYYFSLNIARYGLQFKGLITACKELGIPGYWDHQYTIGQEEKLLRMKTILKGWGVL